MSTIKKIIAQLYCYYQWFFITYITWCYYNIYNYFSHCKKYNIFRNHQYHTQVALKRPMYIQIVVLSYFSLITFLMSIIIKMKIIIIVNIINRISILLNFVPISRNLVTSIKYIHTYNRLVIDIYIYIFKNWQVGKSWSLIINIDRVIC